MFIKYVFIKFALCIWQAHVTTVKTGTENGVNDLVLYSLWLDCTVVRKRARRVGPLVRMRQPPFKSICSELYSFCCCLADLLRC